MSTISKNLFLGFVINASPFEFVMTLKIKCLLITLLFFSYSNSQNLVIDIPAFETPEDDLYNVYEESKIENPIYLNDKVKTVKRQYKQHRSIYNNSVVYTQNYTYTLNTLKRIINYKTNNQYDDSTIESLNLKPKFSTKRDTVIRQGNIEYTFKKGLLMLKKETMPEHVYIDSIVYNYNDHNKLIEIRHYDAYGTYKTDENGNVNEKEMVFDEFELKLYEKATYNSNNILIEKDAYIIGYTTIEHYKTSYSYNKSDLLLMDNKVYKNYYRDYDNEQGDTPLKWNLRAYDLADYMPLSFKTTYKYDNKNRITSYVYTQVDDYGKKEQLEKENKKVTITYNDKLRTRIIESVTTKRSNPIAEPRIRALTYEYFFDTHNNPIKILKYIVRGHKKILDKSTILTITYF